MCPLLPPLARERGRVNTREGHLAKGHKGTLLRRGVCWCFLLVHKLMLRYTVTKYYHFDFLLSGLPSLKGMKFYSGICYRGGCTNNSVHRVRENILKLYLVIEYWILKMYFVTCLLLSHISILNTLTTFTLICSIWLKHVSNACWNLLLWGTNHTRHREHMLFLWKCHEEFSVFSFLQI